MGLDLWAASHPSLPGSLQGVAWGGPASGRGRAWRGPATGRTPVEDFGRVLVLTCGAPSTVPHGPATTAGPPHRLRGTKRQSHFCHRRAPQVPPRVRLPLNVSWHFGDVTFRKAVLAAPRPRGGCSGDQPASLGKQQLLWPPRPAAHSAGVSAGSSCSSCPPWEVLRPGSQLCGTQARPEPL